MTAVTYRRDPALRFVAPWLVGSLLLFVLPMIVLMAVSLLRWDGLSPAAARYVGAQNLLRTLHDDPLARTALANSVVYAAISVPSQLVVGLALALLVRSSRRRHIWATLYYLPHALSGVAGVLVWWWLLNPQLGPINAALRILDHLLGLNSAPLPPWLYSQTWAKPSLALINCWYAGGVMLVFLAALLNVPTTLYEVARLDGAGRLRQFVSITLPLISPALLFNLLTGVIAAMQAFHQPFLLSNAQQRDSLLFYMVYLYRCAFENNDMGYAAALCLILFAILILFTALVLRTTRRRVHFDLGEVIE